MGGGDRNYKITVGRVECKKKIIRYYFNSPIVSVVGNRPAALKLRYEEIELEKKLFLECPLEPLQKVWCN